MGALRRACVVAGLLLTLVAPAGATSYFVDNTPTGCGGSGCSDANAGTPDRAHAWKTWGKFISRFNANAFVGDDTISIRPGRYHVTNAGGTFSLGSNSVAVGGTSGHPIVVQVDTNGNTYPGQVEIDGSTVPGYSDLDLLTAGTNSNATSWAQGKTCAGGTFPGTICDADADCVGGGTCSTTLTNVYWTHTSGSLNSTGFVSGTAFEPGTNPGDPPKFFEILYSPPTDTVTVPTFTAGHDQAWAYTERAVACHAANKPWPCCTGSGVGATCGSTNGTVARSQRLYVQTANGDVPSSKTNHVPVEIPFGGVSIMDQNSTQPVSFLKIANGGNGRTFYFWWGEKQLFDFRNGHDITIEDADVAYNSTAGAPGAPRAAPAWVDSGSGWPRDNGGGMYLIADQTDATHGAYNLVFRRVKVHGSAGDEAFHLAHYEVPMIAPGPGTGSPAGTNCTTPIDCTATTNGAASAICDCPTPDGAGNCTGGVGICVYSRSGTNLFDTVDIEDIPWAVANGAAPNGVSATYSWQPLGYSNAAPPTGYNGIFTFWSPLGGGGESPSCWIIQSPYNHFLRVTTANCSNAAMEIGGDNHGYCDATAASPGSICTVNSTGAGGCAGSSACGTTCCVGLAGSGQVTWGTFIEKSTFDFSSMVNYATASAKLLPSNLVTQCNLAPSGAGCPGGGTCCQGFSGIRGVNYPATFWKTNVPGIAFQNNLIINSAGQPLLITQVSTLNSPKFTPNRVLNNTIQMAGNPADGEVINGQVLLDSGFAGTGSIGKFENNILQETVALSANKAALLISTTNAGIVVDYNDYFGANMTWKYTTFDANFAAWQADVVGGETHGINTDPTFVGGSPFSFDIPAGSTAKDVGVNLLTSGVSDDVHGTIRPQGPAYDMGFMEVVQAGVTTTTVATTSTTSSSSTSTSSTSTTSTSVTTTTSSSVTTTTSSTSSTSSSSTTSTSTSSSSSSNSTSTSSTSSTSTTSLTSTTLLLSCVAGQLTCQSPTNVTGHCAGSCTSALCAGDGSNTSCNYTHCGIGPACVGAPLVNGGCASDGQCPKGYACISDAGSGGCGSSYSVCMKICAGG